MANNYEVNYDDKRFTQVEEDKATALNQLEQTYGDMINDSDSFYDKQIAASKQWEDKQTQLQNEKTDFAIEQINQQKAQAQKDYTREQSGAYVDWQKQSDQYGVNAEQMAAGGLQNSGFSESSQVSMYNTYQNRVATARASFELAKQNYDNAIKDAQIQNNAALAEIAYQAYQQQLELSLQGFQYKNTLIMEKANRKTELENTYYSRYQDVLNQINHENSLAEQIRQYNESLAEEKRQFNETMAYNKAKSSGGGVRETGDNVRVTGGTVGKKVSNTKLGTNEATINSIAKLGYGPLTPEELAEKVYTGKVGISQDKNGNTTFQRADDKLKAGQAALDKYTMLRL